MRLMRARISSPSASGSMMSRRTASGVRSAQARLNSASLAQPRASMPPWPRA